MNQILITTSLALLSAIIGGVIGSYATHRFSSYREQSNKRRELIEKYLLESYDAIAAVSFLDPKDEAQAIERAVDRIQIFGEPELLALTKRFAEEIRLSGQSNTNELMMNLRAQIRRELGLKPVSNEFTILRFHELKEAKR